MENDKQNLRMVASIPWVMCGSQNTPITDNWNALFFLMDRHGNGPSADKTADNRHYHSNLYVRGLTVILHQLVKDKFTTSWVVQATEDTPQLLPCTSSWHL